MALVHQPAQVGGLAPTHRIHRVEGALVLGDNMVGPSAIDGVGDGGHLFEGRVPQRGHTEFSRDALACSATVRVRGFGKHAPGPGVP